jgi:hypothetical protein
MVNFGLTVDQNGTNVVWKKKKKAYYLSSVFNVPCIQSPVHKYYDLDAKKCNRTAIFVFTD